MVRKIQRCKDNIKKSSTTNKCTRAHWLCNVVMFAICAFDDGKIRMINTEAKIA